MPCSMYDGITSGDFANAKADELRRELNGIKHYLVQPREDMVIEYQLHIQNLLYRTARLEEAVCGLCSMLIKNDIELHPQLHSWFEEHKTHPGCTQDEG